MKLNDADNLALGDKTVAAVYKGDVQVYGGGGSTPWTPEDSSTLLGAYLGWDSSALTLSGTDVNEHRCSYGVGPAMVPATEFAQLEKASTIGPDGLTPSSIGSRSAVWYSEPATTKVTDIDTESRGRVLVLLFDVTSLGVNYFLFDLREGSSIHLVNRESATETKWFDASGNTVAPPGSGIAIGTHLFVARSDGAGNTDVRIDGADAYSVGRDTVGESWSGNLGLFQTIYGSSYKDDRGVACHLGAFCLDHDTSLAQAQRYEGWLAHETGLTSLLPAGHPYKSEPPTV